MPAERVSGIPFGLGFTKPHNYWEVVRTAWQNKRNPLFTWRILRDGVCDGCALGTTGMRDFTMKGIHLCTVRLNLLPLNTMGPLDTRILEDVGRLGSVSSKDLRALGRLPYPMLRRRGDPGFHRISWDEALGIAARKIRATPPDRIAFFITSRGMTNESYYVANKVARFLGTNNIDNSSRPCHSPSTTGLKETIGVAASTCSYTDWIGSDLIVFFGSDVPNNQPVTTKFLYYAKKQGTKIAVVNPMREPGLERYWVPSVPDSALFGTRFADAFFPVHTGGDIAFIHGVLKHMIEEGGFRDGVEPAGLRTRLSRERPERGPLRGNLGISPADCTWHDRGRNGRRGPCWRSRRTVHGRRQLPRDLARAGLCPRGVGPASPSDPPGHRPHERDARRSRLCRPPVPRADAIRATRRRHADLHGTARVLLPPNPWPPNRRSTSRVGDLHAIRRTGPA